MSNEELHIDGDFTLNIPHFEADFTENEQPKMQADFKIQTGGSTSFANITGDPYDNEALSDALNQKADNSTVEELSETVTNNYTELDGKITDESDARTQADADLQSNIDDVADDLSIETDNRQTADADLQDNIDTVDGKIDTHIADKNNPHEVTKAQVGLGNVDNTSDLNKPISTATQTALNGKQNTINDLSEIRTNASNGQSAYNTIQNYGDIVTYDASYFATSIQGQKADTALQPNDDISELNNDAGYITNASLPTVNNSTITFQKNNVTVGDINLNQANNETINFNIPTTASDVNALPDTTTINDLTTTAQQNAIDSGATTSNIGQIATNTSNISSLSTTVTNNYNTLDGRITSEVSTLNTTIGTETTNRQNADNNLQSQIDAIVSSSDVFDIVGTYAELQAYDISTVPVNDIIKVLVDSTHSNAATYYRCVEIGGVKSWSYIGSEGAYYTKSESDSLFVEQTTTVNNKPLSTNITLTASDVGALPSSTVIGNGVLTIQNNSVDVDTFNANATSNKTINIVTPTKTSDLTNDSGFIDNTDLTNGLATKQDTLIAGTDLEIIPAQAPILPEGYTQLEYIEGTGTQYIDTGYYGTQNSGAYIRFALTDLTSEGSARVFGTRNGTLGTGAFAFITSKDGTSLPNDNFYIASNGYASQSTNIDANWHEVSCNIENDKKVYFDGNLIFTGGNTAYTSNGQASIFRTYNRTVYGAAATAKISILQIYENAVMVHNFIPCRRDSDDELGMYDLVSDTFFTNSGTGTFIAGADTVFPETDLINFTNESGYIKGIDSTDVITALGYTPYNSTNPDGYTSNVGTVTSVNNTQPDANGNVTLTIPTVNDGVLTITQNGTSKGTFSANQSTNDTIALTDTTYNNFTGADGTNAGSSGLVPAPSATDNDKYLKGDGTWASVSGGSSTDVQINGTSITSGGVANIVTNTAYNASSNKIATMSDLPADKIFVATYGTTTYNEIKTAIQNGKIVVCKPNSITYNLTYVTSTVYAFTYFEPDTCYIVEVTNGNLWSSGSYTYQQTSTAVTHTANTAVGSSTKPIYISSTGAATASTSTVGSSSTPVYLNAGTITSTGLSIANSRFDGQWVTKYSDVASNTAINSYTHSLSTYLPNDSQAYEIFVRVGCNTVSGSSGGSGNFVVGTVASPDTNNNSGYSISLRVTTNSTQARGAIILPIASNVRNFYSQITGHKMDGTTIVLYGYRRIGTNT